MKLIITNEVNLRVVNYPFKKLNSDTLLAAVPEIRDAGAEIKARTVVTVPEVGRTYYYNAAFEKGLFQRQNPMPEATLKEIEEILTKITTGEYRHLQNDWHCGTAHCVGGWKCVRDGMKFFNDPKILQSTYSNQEWNSFIHKMTGDIGLDSGDYARHAWKLSESEASTLYDGGNSLKDLWAWLVWVKAGNRMTWNYQMKDWYSWRGRWKADETHYYIQLMKLHKTARNNANHVERDVV